MPLTRAQHRREAERLLSQASFEQSPEDHTPKLAPQATALLIARAQVHALLASATVVEPADAGEKTQRRDADRAVIVGHIAEGLTDPSRTTRDFMRGFMWELDRVGAGVEEGVRARGERTGFGPYHHTVDGISYSLLTQFTDRDGVVWEHNGDWTNQREPVMSVDESLPGLPKVAMDELVRSRGPLTARKVVDGTPQATGAAS
jgi:hypothetical protein